MAEIPKPIASPLAGQIAIQAMLTTLTALYAGMFENPDDVKVRLTAAVRDMIDASAIPDLPADNQKQIRDEAKVLVGLIISGEDRH